MSSFVEFWKFSKFKILLWILRFCTVSYMTMLNIIRTGERNHWNERACKSSSVWRFQNYVLRLTKPWPLSLQLNHRPLPPKYIPVKKMEKGMLLEHILIDLKVPHSYEVRLTPLTRFGAGDLATRIIHYTERKCLLLYITQKMIRTLYVVNKAWINSPDRVEFLILFKIILKDISE